MLRFDITAATNVVRLDAKGHGKNTFTVSNPSGRPLRVRAELRAEDPAHQSWIGLEGEAERDFPAGGTHQFVGKIEAPAGTAPGTYSCRLNVVSVENPDDDFAEGPSVSFQVRVSEPTTKRFPWWIPVAALVLIAVGAGAWWLFSGPPDVAGPDVSEANLTPGKAPAADSEPIRVVRLLQGAGGSLMSHGFVTPQGYVVAFGPSQDKGEYFLSWLEGGQRVERLARVVKQRDDRGQVPFLVLLKPAEGGSGAPRPAIRNAGSLNPGDPVERYLSASDRTPGTVIEHNGRFSMGSAKFPSLVTTDISGPGDAGAPVVDSGDRIVAVVVGGGGGKSFSIPIENIKLAFQQAF